MISKRITGLALCLLLSFSCVTFAEEGDVADITDSYEDAAVELYMDGLFKGGNNGFDLSSESTKAQAAVMVVRLLGAESDVLSSSYSHPYSDVTGWSSNYVGYIYTQGIDIAKEATVFGANDNITLEEFLVLVIQALGYTDVSLQDTPDEVFEKAIEIGLLTEEEKTQIENTEFDRGTMVYVSRNALRTLLADSENTLYDDLSAKSVIKQYAEPDDAVKYGTVKEVLTVVKEETKPDMGQTILSKASPNLGIRYRSGGKSPSTGFDCSGFVGYVMMQSGVWSSHPGSCDGIASRCKVISMSEAKPGDIVFFKGTYKTSHKYSHVGIYMGDGKIIHSASSKGVSISTITSGYWANHYSCIARPTSLM